MTNSIGWYDKNRRVVLHSYEGKTSIEDFIDMATQSANLLASVDYPVQLIVDRTNAFFPEFQPTKMKIIQDLVPDNQDLVIVVGAERAVEMVSIVVGKRIAPKAFSNSHYVATMEHALDILKRERGIEV